MLLYYSYMYVTGYALSNWVKFALPSNLKYPTVWGMCWTSLVFFFYVWNYISLPHISSSCPCNPCSHPISFEYILTLPSFSLPPSLLLPHQLNMLWRQWIMTVCMENRCVSCGSKKTHLSVAQETETSSSRTWTRVLMTKPSMIASVPLAMSSPARWGGEREGGGGGGLLTGVFSCLL